MLADGGLTSAESLDTSALLVGRVRSLARDRDTALGIDRILDGLGVLIAARTR